MVELRARSPRPIANRLNHLVGERSSVNPVCLQMGAVIREKKFLEQDPCSRGNLPLCYWRECSPVELKITYIIFSRIFRMHASAFLKKQAKKKPP